MKSGVSLFPNILFSIKADMRGWSFFSGGDPFFLRGGSSFYKKKGILL